MKRRTKKWLIVIVLIACLLLIVLAIGTYQAKKLLLAENSQSKVSNAAVTNNTMLPEVCIEQWNHGLMSSEEVLLCIHRYQQDH
jgi:CHASE1-domain containing sensor protein